jgi:glutaredoxin 3
LLVATPVINPRDIPIGKIGFLHKTFLQKKNYINYMSGRDQKNHKTYTFTDPEETTQVSIMKFTVYSKNGCPYCTKVKQVLELSNLEHVVYTLGEHFNREDFYAEFGKGSTFPQVILNDQQQLGGCTDTVRYLKEQNIV